MAKVALAPEQAASEAQLRYVSDELPGYTRRRCGKGFSYYDPQGRLLRDRAQRDWIKSLAIPPAWSQVWISPDRSGHLLATGRDEKGRKQYIYHPRWHAQRQETNFHRLLPFGEALPALRERIDADLRRPGLPRERLLALVVRLLQSTLVRVGNPQYAQQNQSFGLTTLRENHLELEGTHIHLEFRGKSGRWQQVDLRDPRAARAIRRCQELPGQSLFQYYDAEGGLHNVESADVNAYLTEACGEAFTAKLFRTWGGSVAALAALLEMDPPTSKTATERNIAAALKVAAERLANTKPVTQRHYVDPLILQRYREGRLLECRERARDEPGLSHEEAVLLEVLRSQV